MEFNAGISYTLWHKWQLYKILPEKKSKKESEKLCKIVDSRNYPASVILITDAGIVFAFLIYLFIYLFTHRSIHIWVCKLILYPSLNKAKSCGFCIWTCIFTGFSIVAGTDA